MVNPTVWTEVPMDTMAQTAWYAARQIGDGSAVDFVAGGGVKSGFYRTKNNTEIEVVKISDSQVR